MMSLTNDEAQAVATIDAAHMLDQVERWAGVNSGTRNLAGCATMAGLLGDAFAALPGGITLVEGPPVESVAADGSVSMLAHICSLARRAAPPFTRARRSPLWT